MEASGPDFPTFRDSPDERVVPSSNESDAAKADERSFVDPYHHDGAEESPSLLDTLLAGGDRPGLDFFHVGARLDLEIFSSTVFLHGELDIDTQPLLESEVDRLVEQGARHLILDLSDLTFVGVAGLRLFAALHHRMALLGGSLTLRRPSGHVRKVLAVCGFALIIDP
jgi:anti-sigma B factor antagonist